MTHPIPDATLDHWLATARLAAAAATAVHQQYSGRIDILDADAKGFADFVSRVDVEAQEAALELIARRHPDHLILAEEGEAEDTDLPSDGTPIWVVDPLDGTNNYLHGHPNYAASVALAVEGRPVAACVHAGATSETWWARSGGGAWRNGRSIRTSAPRHWQASLVATGFMFRGEDRDLTEFTRQMARVKAAGAGIRRCGAAALDLCFVADGRYEGFWEHFLNPWDYAAGWLIVEEAGGAAGRMDGAPLGLPSGGIVAVNHRDTLPRLLDLLAGGTGD